MCGLCERSPTNWMVVSIWTGSTSKRALWGHAVPTVKFSDLYFPVKQPREAVYYTPEQLTAILAAFAGREPWDMFFTLLANTGSRTSEILTLRVADLDFTKGRCGRVRCRLSKMRAAKVRFP